MFVGQAGRLLDRALMTAGLERTELYLTNAVKHFKWTPRGKRRIHQTPNRGELVACRPWLEAEIAAVQPELIVALGATAAKALIGPDVRVTRDRGLFVDQDGVGLVMPTVHPSSVLRADASSRGEAFDAFVAGLKSDGHAPSGVCGVASWVRNCQPISAASPGEHAMPPKSAHVKNEKQYEALKEKGMSKSRAAGSPTRPRPPRTAARSPAPGATPTGRNHRVAQGCRPQGWQGDGQEALTQVAAPASRHRSIDHSSHPARTD